MAELMLGHPDPAIPRSSDLLERLAGRIATLERQVRDLAVGSSGGAVFGVAVVANLPAAGRKGRLVIFDADSRLYRDNGTSWVAVG